MIEKYKFEKYKDASFPVYVSSQKGKGNLVVPHFHSAAEIIKVTQGEGILFLETEQYPCRKGDILFIPPFSTHAFWGAGAIRGIIFELSLLQTDSLGFSPEQILAKDAVTEFVFRETKEIYHRLDRAFSRCLSAYEETGVTHRLEMLSALYGITAYLVKACRRGEEESRAFCRLQPVMDYIHENYRDPIALSELGGMIHVCDDHLIRLFKAATHKTPIRYVADLRLQEAMKLLISTQLSVTEIAYKTGFSDVSYLTRLFRQRLNLTPGQYRKNGK